MIMLQKRCKNRNGILYGIFCKEISKDSVGYFWMGVAVIYFSIHFFVGVLNGRL